MQKAHSKKNLGSYPYMGVLVSITLALFVTGLFGILVSYSRQLEKLVRQNIRLEVYLRNGLTETQRTQVEKKLEALPYLYQRPAEDPALRFVSKEEAAKQFIAETGEDFTKFLGDNPLHDAYLVSINPEFHSAAGMEKIKTEIENMNGVFQVVPKEGLIESVNKNVANIGLILLGFLAVLLITTVLLINNTIRLALFSQRFLIRSMQLVGARNWFIQRPFLVRSVLYGLLSGLIASAGIWGSVRYANQKIEDLAALQNTNLTLALMGALLALGMLVAVASTFFSIRKYLKMSLDDLY